jgi:hypothetical protein
MLTRRDTIATSVMYGNIFCRICANNVTVFNDHMIPKRIFLFIFRFDSDTTVPQGFDDPSNHYFAPSASREHWSAPTCWQMAFLVTEFA